MDEKMQTEAKPKEKKSGREERRDASGSLQPVADRVRHHILDAANKLAKKSQENAKAESQLIPNLIALHQRFLSIVKDCFDNTPMFKKALNSSFRGTTSPKGIMNADFTEFAKEKGEYHMSNLLAQFCHSILKKGSNHDVKDFDSILDQAKG